MAFCRHRRASGAGWPMAKKHANSYPFGAPTACLTCSASSQIGIRKAQASPSFAAASSTFSMAALAEAK